MDLTGEHILPLPRERVYEALLDPDTLRAAIPGCESVARGEDGTYGVAVVTAIGPVKARFKGTLRIENPRRPEGYLMRFEGDGGVAGFARGSAEITLDEAGAGQTRLRYAAQAQIGGRLASIGARLIDASAAKLSGQFFGRLTELLSAPPRAAGVATASGASGPVSAPAAGVATGAPAPVAGGGQAVQTPSAPARNMVTLQMPAWTWAVSVAVLAALAAYLGR